MLTATVSTHDARLQGLEGVDQDPAGIENLGGQTKAELARGAVIPDQLRQVRGSERRRARERRQRGVVAERRQAGPHGGQGEEDGKAPEGEKT